MRIVVITIFFGAPAVTICITRHRQIRTIGIITIVSSEYPIAIGIHKPGCGIGIGVIQRDMAVGQAMQTYTILSIGDGLVSQIPALVISTAAETSSTRGGRRCSSYCTSIISGCSDRSDWSA